MLVSHFFPFCPTEERSEVAGDVANRPGGDTGACFDGLGKLLSASGGLQVGRGCGHANSAWFLNGCACCVVVNSNFFVSKFDKKKKKTKVEHEIK